MRVGLVVDGLSEVRALPLLYRRIDLPHTLVATLRADLQPHAPAGQIALRASARCKVLSTKRPDLIIVLLDLETRRDCTGDFASAIQKLIVDHLGKVSFKVEVVIKVRTFENWLISDIQCMSRTPSLFVDAARVARSVPAGNADGIDAMRILQQASGRRRPYEKVAGAVATCQHLDPGRAALNSRSFRRFLRVLGDIRYADQSRLPSSDI
jgi:Domain of unknown function (DUF4276)